MTGPSPPSTDAPAHSGRVRAATGTAPIETEGRTAVEKACVLLSAFSHHPDGVIGVSELARRSGLTKSTAFRQLNILERAAMVERVGRGYRIGRGIKALAHGAIEHEHTTLIAELTPYLVEAFEHARQTVQLGVLDGDDIVFLATIRGHHTLATPNHPRLRLPAHTTAGGRLLLAYRGTPLPAVGTAHLLRRQSVAFDIGDTDTRVCCVAAAITTSSYGPPLASISICAPTGTSLAAAANILIHISRVASRHLKASLANLG